MNFALLRARAARASAIKALQHVGHHEQRRILREPVALVGGDDGKAGAGLQRRLDEVMAVAHILEREERLARRDGAGVDGESRHGLRQRALAA